jgi:hypothetical protein
MDKIKKNKNDWNQSSPTFRICDIEYAAKS